MKRPSALWLAPVAAVLLLLVPAAASAHATNSPALLAPNGGAGGSVFVMSNAASGNVVLAYHIGTGGALVPAGHFPTHGKGTGASLADSGGIVLTQDHRFLLVVNAGSNSVTVFSVHAPTATTSVLSYVDTVRSHGVSPVSIALHGPVVYVLNAGNATTAGNIAGFLLVGPGWLFALPHSSQPLSTSSATGPAQVGFNPAGTVLVVTEKSTNQIDTYPVNALGIAQSPIFTTSNGTTPYGFAFNWHGALIVSDAASGALSSYTVARSGALTLVSGSVADGQLAPCWVAVAHNGTFAYTTDAHSASISSYTVGSGGTLTLLASVAATTGAADTDMAVGGAHAQYLLVTDAGAAEIQEFRIGSTGGLTLLDTLSALPSTVEGMAAY
ncbi:MAG: lactonase family protein [Thermoplasmata archaeon]|nr:lactonase family protein [Thermoplasmata archaeon]MCI4356296.1 lactonase family protein [Thermoplasmata archaeon]